MKGYAVAIQRVDGSLFFAAPSEGFATCVWPGYAEAMEYAKDCRKHRLRAIVVNVEYSDPIITGPARVLAVTPKEPTP